MLDKLRKDGVRDKWPVIQAALKHHCKASPGSYDIQLYPDSYETLLVHLADTLASQASRVLKKLEEKLRGLGTNYCVYKLWKGALCYSDRPPLYDKYEILNAFEA